MKLRGLVLSVLLGVFALAITGCSLKDKSVDTVLSAIKKYENSKDVKVVYCYVNSGTKSTTSVEVRDGENSYSEVPYTSASGDAEATDVENATNQQYLLYDWVKKDGSAYTLNSAYNDESEDSKLWIEMPKGYGNVLWGRTNLYARDMLDTQSLKKGDKESINLGSGEEEVQTYTCDITSAKIRNILETETTGLVKLARQELAKKKETKNTKKVEKFLKDTLDNYESVSAYADGKVVYGIKNKELVYVRLETGGLGTSYSLERVVLNQEVQVRDEPTFKGNTDTYYDLALSYVNYSKQLEDLQKVQESQGVSSDASDVDSTESSATESTEVNDTESTEAGDSSATTEDIEK